MQEKDFKLLPDEYKNSIIRALTDAKKIDIHEFISEYNPETLNGIYFLLWDFIYSNLIRNAADDRLIPIKFKRGFWTLLLLYDTELKYLYTLMKHKRFKQLQDQRKNRSMIHYIDALALLNDGLEAEMEQLCLFENEEFDNAANELLYNIVREYQDEIERFVIIGFSTSKDDITSVTAIVPSPGLGVVYEEDWSEFIPMNYVFNSVTFDYTSLEEEEEDIPVTLKKQPETDGVPSVNLKNDEDNVGNEES